MSNLQFLGDADVVEQMVEVCRRLEVDGQRAIWRPAAVEVHPLASDATGNTQRSEKHEKSTHELSTEYASTRPSITMRNMRGAPLVFSGQRRRG